MNALKQCALSPPNKPGLHDVQMTGQVVFFLNKSLRKQFPSFKALAYTGDYVFLSVWYGSGH